MDINKFKFVMSFSVIILIVVLLSTVVFGGSDQNPAEYGFRQNGCSAIMRKAPYLIFNGDNSEMEVHWQLWNTLNCSLRWGADTTYSVGEVQTEEYGSKHQHQYTITGLNPGGKYYYEVIADSETYSASFRAAPPDDATDLTFFAYGDTRSYPNIHNQVVAGVVSAFEENDTLQTFMLSTGDLVSNGNSESDWDNQFFSPSYENIQDMLANMPYQSAMGNHEDSGILFSSYFPYPFVDGHYWSFDYGPAHFVVVDQYTNYSPGSAQLQWIEDDLATTDKRWKFIALHEPGWSAGGGHSNNQNVQNYIQPLCEQYGVQIVFGGHNHYYARAVVDEVEHITTGGGGAPLYHPDPSYPYIVATNMSHHYCKIDIHNDLLNFTAINMDGAVIDTFSIVLPPNYVDDSQIPGKLGIELVAYPNPFNSTATIEFRIPQNGYAALDIYDLLGRKVEALIKGRIDSGWHSIKWNANSYANGIYFCRLEYGGRNFVNRVLFLK